MLGLFLLCGLSLVAVNGGYTVVVVDGLLIAVASLVAEQGLSRHVGSVVVASGL